MAKNRLIDVRKKHQSQSRVLEKLTPTQDAGEGTPHDKLVYREYFQSAKKALLTLTPQRRRIFEMRTESEMSIDEIAKKLDISQSAVKKQLYEAVNLVKKHLFNETGWPILLLAIASAF